MRSTLLIAIDQQGPQPACHATRAGDNGLVTSTHRSRVWHAAARPLHFRAPSLAAAISRTHAPQPLIAKRHTPTAQQSWHSHHRHSRDTQISGDASRRVLAADTQGKLWHSSASNCAAKPVLTLVRPVSCLAHPSLQLVWSGLRETRKLVKPPALPPIEQRACSHCDPTLM